MEQNDLKHLRDFLLETETDDLEDYLEVSLSNSPNEAVSLAALILFDKTNDVKYMDQALQWAEKVATATTSRRECVARLDILIPMLAQKADSFQRAVQLGLADVLDILVEAGLDSEEHAISGQALLHEACRGENTSVAHILLKGGIDVNERNARSETALMVATELGNETLVRSLLEHKADMEAEDQDGDSALHTAAYHGFESIARLLLENGAKPAVCGGSGYTPMQLALNRGHLNLAKLLEGFKAFPDLADDTRVPLSEISGEGIYRQIEQAQGMLFPAALTLDWLDRMRFVVAAGEGAGHDIELIAPGPGGTLDEPYIAISYCWGRHSNSEEPLLIRDPFQTKPESTEIRKARASRQTLLRSLDYAAAKGVKRIWIDQECINQDDPEDKRDALQNMHLVYRRAAATLVLLGHHIQTPVEIAYLQGNVLKPGPCPDLVKRITSDAWFTRAWTCQEYGVTPTKNLRYLVGWDEALDPSGDRWRFASHSFNLRRENITQSVPRAWELGHREIGAFSFHGDQSDHIIGLVQEIGVMGTAGADGFTYTLTADGVEGMHWWKRGLCFRFSDNARDMLRAVTDANQVRPKSSQRQQEWPRLRMTLLAALCIQRRKACTVFSDKLAILGNLTDYPYRLHASDAHQNKLSFSACVLAMALFNGDLSPLFTTDLAFLDHDRTADFQRGLLLSQTNLYTLADGRSAYSMNRAHITAGSRCLSLGGKFVVEGMLWKIVPFTAFSGLQKNVEPRLAKDKRDPVRFHFLQKLVFRIVSLERMDLLELIVVVVMRRQLTSPLELVHILNELQAWARNERHWPADIFDETFLERQPAGPGASFESADGRTRKVVEYLKVRETTGLEYALMELESDDSQPEDLLSYIYHATGQGQPLALGECTVGDRRLVSLFMLDPSQYEWVLTPVNELDYEFGTNPWLHRHSKNTFWCVVRSEQTVSDAEHRRASRLLNCQVDVGNDVSREVLHVVTSGTRSHTFGMWSPRLSRRGLLVIADDGSWEMTPLGQAARYYWLADM